MKVNSASIFSKNPSSLIHLGLALATSIAETLCRSQAFSIIATHLQQLTSIGYVYRNVANYHFDVVYNDKVLSDIDSDSTNPPRTFNRLNEENNIIYSYTLRPGTCKDRHYGKVKFFLFHL